MTQLHERLAARVREWRAQEYESLEYPAIADFLDWAREPETGTLRFLRRPQPVVQP